MSGFVGPIVCSEKDRGCSTTLAATTTATSRMTSKRQKVALVTGSATGIGANIAIDLAASGYFVIVTGRNESNLKRVVSKCNEAAVAANHDGCQSGEHDGECDPTTTMSQTSATYFIADLADFGQLDELIKFVSLNFQRLDVLINNACWRGKHKRFLISDEAYDDFKQVMHINVSVPHYLIHRCLIPMRARSQQLQQQRPPKGDAYVEADDKAVIINMSSIASQVLVPLHLYSVSKACFSELSRQLSQLASHELGILTVTIAPGPVMTDERPHHQEMSNLTLMRRVGNTQEISNLVMFAINNARISNGQELTIDGGYVAKPKQSSASCAVELETLINNQNESKKKI